MILTAHKGPKGEALSKFIAPDHVKGKSAMRIARLEALVTALEDALRETDDLLLTARIYDGLNAEQDAHARTLLIDNASLRGAVAYYMGEGRTL